MVNIKTIRMVKTMKIAICDDEPNFTKIFKNYISEYAAHHDLSNKIELFYSAPQLLAADLSNYDVLFLDIKMPGINGIETARQLREKYTNLFLVFVTGWLEYAPSGYRVNAFRYLLKKNLPGELWDCLDDIQEKMIENTECILLRSKKCVLNTPIKTILYFEGTRKKTILLYLKNEVTPIECNGTLSELETKLTESGFLRIQKSFLVNMAYIEKIRSYKVILRNGKELKASERQYSKINQQYLMWKGRIL